ncbi:hypothetical protein Mame01_65480 [Microbispora amethystogenes]|nr:hypothetical protein Mame01_65480 [Microbispora amethystogenes]
MVGAARDPRHLKNAAAEVGGKASIGAAGVAVVGTVRVLARCVALACEERGEEE